MKTISTPTFTEAQQRFVDYTMQSYQLAPTNAAYNLIARKAMDNLVMGYEVQSLLVTKATYTLAKEIQEKYFIAELNDAAEAMLLGKTVYIKKPKVKKNLTKALSYSEFCKEYAGTTAVAILGFVKKNPDATRRQVAEQLQMRLSTVCGAVHPLVRDGYVNVTGKVLDTDSNRYVETLGA